MKKLYFIIFICIPFFIIGCASQPMKRIDNGMMLFDWKILKDQKLLKQITEYQNEYFKDGKGVAYVIISKKNAFKENSEKYIISSYKNLSNLFDFPFTSYFMHNEKPVLIYFEKGPFMNPKNYPKNIVENVFAKNLHNNWNRYYDSEKDEIVDFISYFLSFHPPVWNYKDGKKTNEIQKSLSEILYGEDGFRYTSYINLDNYRTDFSELKLIREE